MKRKMTTSEILEDFKTRFTVKDHERTEEFNRAFKLFTEGVISKDVFKKILEADRNIRVMTPDEYDNLPKFDPECAKGKNGDELEIYLTGPFKMGERSSEKYAMVLTGELVRDTLNEDKSVQHNPRVKFNTKMVALTGAKSTIEEAGEVVWSDNPDIIENRINEISRDISD